jgi:hypothetical protein
LSGNAPEQVQLRRTFMARTKSKSGRKTGGGRKKATSKRGGRKTSASTRSKTGARKAASKRGGTRKATRKTAARKTGRKATARGGTRGRSAGASARSTRTAARKTSRSSGQRGRKSRSSQTSGPDTMGGEGGESEEGGQLEGEGSYTASRHFRTAQTGFVQRNRGRIARMGKEAEAALEGREGAELRGAEDEARSHSAGDDQW